MYASGTCLGSCGWCCWERPWWVVVTERRLLQLGLQRVAIRKTSPQLHTHSTAAQHSQAELPLLYVILLAALVLFVNTPAVAGAWLQGSVSKLVKHLQTAAAGGGWVWDWNRQAPLLLQHQCHSLGSACSADQAPNCCMGLPCKCVLLLFGQLSKDFCAIFGGQCGQNNSLEFPAALALLLCNWAALAICCSHLLLPYIAIKL